MVHETSPLVKLVSIQYYILMSDIVIQLYLERIGGLLRAETRALLTEYSLPPVQFEALQYLSLCNRYSDSPKGVTEYLGQTKGTVSQSLKALENKGYIVKKPDKDDGRVVHLSVTEKAQKLVNELGKLPVLSQYCQQQSTAEIETLELSLKKLLVQLQKINHRRSFGQCKTCVHHIKNNDGTYTCGLTKEPLSISDIDLICLEHE